MMRHGCAGGGPVVSKPIRSSGEQVTHLVSCDLVLALIQWSTYCDHCTAWRRSNTAMTADCRKIETSATHQHPGGAFAKHWQLLSCRPKCNERGSTPLLQRATVSPTQSDITLQEL
jgi:hypothetical protein